MSPTSGGAWTESVIYSFTGGQQDQRHPVAAVLLDPTGNVFGTASGGFATQAGTAFMLAPNADGSWTYTTLYAFGKKAGDAANPQSGMAQDAAGNLYGTTAGGGFYGSGAVYELARGANGKWGERVLASLITSSGLNLAYTPPAVTIGRGHILYGVTSTGGSMNRGEIFQIVP